MKTMYQLVGLCVIAIRGIIDSFKIYTSIWLVALATIFAACRIAYVSGIIRGQGL